MDIIPKSPADKVAREFELDDAAFTAWWNHIAREDREEFTMIFQGDEYLARFVCALDYLLIQKVQADSRESLFTLAYWIAARRFEPELDLQSPSTRNRAIRAWQSDAVQSLHDRVRYRSIEQGHIKLTNRLFSLAETMADMADSPDATMKDKKMAADVLVKISELVNTEKAVTRAERTKRGLEKAREAMNQAGMDSFSERELAVMLRAGEAKVGKEKLLELISGR